MTIADMIAELESDLNVRRAADMRIKLWETLFRNASDYEKRGMLVTALKELCGLSDSEIKRILK